MPRPFYHDLHTEIPGPLGQLAQENQFLDLPPVCGVGNAPRPQTIAKTQNHIIPGGNLTQPVKLLVEGIFPFIVAHPSLKNRPSPADNPQDTPLLVYATDASLCHTAMNGNKIDAVPAVFFYDCEQIISGHLHNRFPILDHLCGRLIYGGRYRRSVTFS